MYAFANFQKPKGVKYTAYIVGDSKSRVFCPANVTKEEAEQFFAEFCLQDDSAGSEPICLVLVWYQFSIIIFFLPNFSCFFSVPFYNLSEFSAGSFFMY